LKREIKEQVIEEITPIIYERIKEVIGPSVAEGLQSFMDFPLTVRQVASMTGRTPDSVYKMCRRCKIPFTKLGSYIHISLKDLNNLLQKEREE